MVYIVRLVSTRVMKGKEVTSRGVSNEPASTDQGASVEAGTITVITSVGWRSRMSSGTTGATTMHGSGGVAVRVVVSSFMDVGRELRRGPRGGMVTITDANGAVPSLRIKQAITIFGYIIGGEGASLPVVLSNGSVEHDRERYVSLVGRVRLSVFVPMRIRGGVVARSSMLSTPVAGCPARLGTFFEHLSREIAIRIIAVHVGGIAVSVGRRPCKEISSRVEYIYMIRFDDFFLTIPTFPPTFYQHFLHRNTLLLICGVFMIISLIIPFS